MGPEILLTLCLVLLNGFFVAAEFAIVKVRISQIQVKALNSFTGRIAESVVSNAGRPSRARRRAHRPGSTLSSRATDP